MRVSVIRKEETSFFVEHNDPPFHGADFPEIENFIEELQEVLARLQCYTKCMDEDDIITEEGCPCPIAMSSL